MRYGRTGCKNGAWVVWRKMLVGDLFKVKRYPSTVKQNFYYVIEVDLGVV